MKRLRGKLTYSNVMVTVLAVIVLGGGSAYAASVGLKPNSVGPAQLKDGAVDSEALKDGSVTPAKLAAATKSQLKGQTGATGAQGPVGPQGAAGPQGAPGAAASPAGVETEVVNLATAKDATAEKELTVQCPHGPVLGGGFVLAPQLAAAEPRLRAVRSYAVTPNSWLVRAFDDGGADTWELTVTAVCEK